MIRSIRFGANYPMPLKKQTEISSDLQDKMTLKKVDNFKKTLQPDELEIINQGISNLKKTFLQDNKKVWLAIKEQKTPDQLAEKVATDTILNVLSRAKTNDSAKSRILTLFKSI